MKHPHRRHCISIAVTAVHLCVLCSMAFGQSTPPSIQWERAYGGTDQEYAESIQQTSDSGFIVAGYSVSTNGDITGNHGSADYWIVRLDAKGAIKWQRSLGGSAFDNARSVVQTPDGGFLVGAESASTDGDVTGNLGGSDYWIVKLDVNGNTAWQKSYGSSSLDRGYCMQLTADGGFVIAGELGGAGGHGQSDFCLSKFDGNGNSQWQKKMGGTKSDYAYSVRQTSDGGYVLAGYTNSNDGDVSGNHGNNDYWVVKTDAAGNLQWQKTLGGTADDYATNVVQSADGSYVVVGYAYSADGDVTGAHGNDDCWVVKLDGSGNLQWQKALGGGGYDAGECVIQTTDGCFVVTGAFSGSSYAMAKLDPAGNILWQKLLGNGGSSYSLQQTNDGGFVVAGGAGSGTGFHGFIDYWIVKLGWPTIASSQQQSLPTLTCGATRAFDTLWVHNTEIAPLVISSAPFADAIKNFFLQTPATFPVTVAVGDSVKFIVRFSPTINGTLNDTLLCYNNDSSDTRNPWKIAFAGQKDSIGFALQGLNKDTLDFGSLTCSVSGDKSFVIANTSTSATTFVLNSSSAVFILPFLTTYAHSGEQITVVVHFAGGASKNYFDSIVVGDTCGRTHTVYLRARIDIIGVVAQGIDNATLHFGQLACNTSRDTVFTLSNVSSVATTCSLQSDNPVFTVTSPVVLSLGALQPITIHFLGGAPGYYSATLYITDVCGKTETIALDATVDSAAIEVSALRDTTICPGDSSVRIVTIHNFSGTTQDIHFSGGGASSSVMPDSISVAAGDSATVTIVFHSSGAIGTYAVNYAFADNCGVGHAITETIHVDTASVTALAIAEVVTCPNDSAVQQSWLHNISAVTQTIVLAGDNGLFSISPDSLTLAAGDSAMVSVMFRGAAAGGTYTVHYTLPGCGETHTFSATVRVDTGTITALAVLDTTVCPGAAVSRTLMFRNTSGVPQNVHPTGDNALFTLSPDSMLFAPGASGMFTIVFRGSSTVGVNNINYLYQDACGISHSLTVRVVVDTQSVTMQALSDTTVCPGDAAVRRVVVHNFTNVTQHVQLSGTDALFSVAPNALTIAPGDSATFDVSFRGSNTLGKHSVTYTYPDACGSSHDLIVSMSVDTASVTTSSIADATICPGVTVFHSVVIRNVSSSPQDIQLNSGDAHFSYSPARISLAPGDSETVQLVFQGAVDTGTYTTVTVLPGCGIGSTITATVHVQAPNIRIPVSLDTSLCPFTPIVFTIPITNGDAVARTLSLGSTNGVLSRQSIVLGANQMDSVTLTLPGGPAGAVTATVTVTDECGIAHIISITVTIGSAPTLQLSLQTDAGATRVGVERRVYLIATPSSSVAAGNFTFTVTNEPTALEFDRIATPCATSIIRGANLQTITFTICSTPASDTIAAIYYQTLVGSTLSPGVTLQNATTTNTCDTVSGAGTATIALLAPGCELGTVVVHPFATTIQSIFPNPATGVTSISYSTATEAPLSLIVYDALGRTVQTLADGAHKPGNYTAAFETRGLMSGAYYLMMRVGSHLDSKELLIAQ